MQKKSLYWFRKNLRLQDNPSLQAAVNSGDELTFVFVWDERWESGHEAGFPVMGPLRKRFWLDSLQQLREELQEKGADLLLLQGNPGPALVDFAKSRDIPKIYGSNEPGQYEQNAESFLSGIVELELQDDNSLIPVDSLPFSLDRLPGSFSGYRKKVEKSLNIRSEITVIEVIGRAQDHASSSWPKSPNEYPDPRTAFLFEAGEANAWKRLQTYFWDEKRLFDYKSTRNGMLGPEYSSKFSRWLATGAISPVSIFHEIKRFEKEVRTNQSTYWLFFELLWRDFFRMVSFRHGARVFIDGGIKDREPHGSENKEAFEKWTQGQTGNDFVDANMRELLLTGFMSNRGRQNVASYLQHQLKVKWQWGAAWFESALLDYDVNSNWGNWMYLADVGNDPRSRVFNVKGQAQRYDPDGAYRTTWLNFA